MARAERVVEVPKARKPVGAGIVILALIPIVLLAGIVYLVLTRGPGAIVTTPVPVERLDFERVEFRPNEILVSVRNSGPDTVDIAHIIINGALWNFSVSPDPAVPRLGRATLSIPYDWVEGEPYAIELVTSGGFKFGHDVDAAFLTPRASAKTLWAFALLGIYVGLIPVYLGLIWFPALRRLSRPL